jgi:hypothetical protein
MLAFEEWYNGWVGFEITRERILDDLFHHASVSEDEKRLQKWLRVCWNQALEAAHEYNGVDVEVLKA